MGRTELEANSRDMYLDLAILAILYIRQLSANARKLSLILYDHHNDGKNNK